MKSPLLFFLLFPPLLLTRASGAGGQNVNKVETAIDLIHKPTGFTDFIRVNRVIRYNLIIFRNSNLLSAGEKSATE